MPLFRRLCVFLFAICCAFAWPPRLAQAHAILLDASPAVGSSVPAGRIAFTLRFNSRIDRARSRLNIVGPGSGSGSGSGTEAARSLPIAQTGRPDVMTTSADLAAGDYTLRWQVLAVDGHITRGDVPFAVTAKP